MKLDVSLWVSHKGVDLVASTAYLTLADKMGYGDKLLAIERLDVYELSIECDEPEATVAVLQRVFTTQSSYYNRNKHIYSLQCRWDGGEVCLGVPLEELKQRLGLEAFKKLSVSQQEDFDRKKNPARVILSHVPVFRAEVLIEDLDAFSKTALARRLERELSTAPIDVTALGSCWYLALATGNADDARVLAEEIVVTAKRDRGLLLNPNDQGFRILAVEPVKAVS